MNMNLNLNFSISVHWSIECSKSNCRTSNWKSKQGWIDFCLSVIQKGAQGTVTEKVKNRLEQLDDFEEVF